MFHLPQHALQAHANGLEVRRLLNNERKEGENMGRERGFDGGKLDTSRAEQTPLRNEFAALLGTT